MSSALPEAPEHQSDVFQLERDSIDLSLLPSTHSSCLLSNLLAGKAGPLLKRPLNSTAAAQIQALLTILQIEWQAGISTILR